MEKWLAECAAQIRDHVSTTDDGALWTLFFDDPTAEPLMAFAVEGVARAADIMLIQRIAQVAGGVGASACLFAVIRLDGLPQPEDLQVWKHLQLCLPLSSGRALGFLVVSQTACWAAGPNGELAAVA